jgi:hypothetical protein
MPDSGNLQHDIALLERAIEYCVETLTFGRLSTAECQVICEEMASLERAVAALNRRLELAR